MVEGEERSWPVTLGHKEVKVSGRACVYRLDAKSADAALRKAKHESSRKQHVIRTETIESCKYVVLFTTLSRDELSLEEVFSIYRLRWQIELAFKRLKSLTGFGHLPKHDPVSCRAWLYGKLLVGLLVESMVRIPFPP
jgi:IS4 transposase